MTAKNVSRNKCWKNGCSEKIRARISLMVSDDEGRCELTGGFCPEHFKEAWNDKQFGYKLFAEAFIKKHEPKKGAWD